MVTRASIGSSGVSNSYSGSDRSLNMGESSTGTSSGAAPALAVNVSGGPLSYQYSISRARLHYGERDLQGSEHTIDNHAFPAEVSTWTVIEPPTGRLKQNCFLISCTLSNLCEKIVQWLFTLSRRFMTNIWKAILRVSVAIEGPGPKYKSIWTIFLVPLAW